MVRLKVRAFLMHLMVMMHFNSTMVRLKAFVEVRFFNIFLYFNSTMVRLKDIQWILFSHGLLFQFHYGTIKSLYAGIRIVSA